MLRSHLDTDFFLEFLSLVDTDIFLWNFIDKDAGIHEDDRLSNADVVLSASLAGCDADILHVSDGVHLDWNILLLE